MESPTDGSSRVHPRDAYPRGEDPRRADPGHGQPVADEPAAAALQPGVLAWCRRLARIVLLSAATFALVIVWFAGLPFTMRRPRRRNAWRRRIFQAWSRTSLRICRVHWHVSGRLPVEPCFLVTNHLGYLDILVIEAAFDATFVSMSELQRWPVFGAMARQFGTIFVDRERKRGIPQTNREMDAALARSNVVVLFPEGRHSRGTGVLPFKSSLFEPAARTGRPVAWGVLHYATGPGDPPAARVVPWVGVSFARQALVLLAVSRVDAHLEIGSDVVSGPDRKQLAEATRTRILSRLVPLDAG
jgi:1-acyl-sn-glycerol-3-phosphate acyltransferase